MVSRELGVREGSGRGGEVEDVVERSSRLAGWPLGPLSAEPARRTSGLWASAQEGALELEDLDAPNHRHPPPHSSNMPPKASVPRSPMQPTVF